MERGLADAVLDFQAYVDPPGVTLYSRLVTSLSPIRSEILSFCRFA